MQNDFLLRLGMTTEQVSYSPPLPHFRFGVVFFFFLPRSSKYPSCHTQILYIYIYICKDPIWFESKTGMDPGPRSPNNEFIECGKES